MGLETEYVEYAIELSLAVLGVSASYLIDANNPITLLGLILLPILYAYTAYISHDGFNRASLVTLFTLMFAVVGGITAAVAVAFSIGNIFVSVFSGGKQVKDFYGATSIPLLLTGILIGGVIFGYGTVNTEFKQNSVDRAAQTVGVVAEKTFQDSGLVENQKNSQLHMINSTSTASTRLMTQQVLNETDPSQEVRISLIKAQKDVPDRIYEKSSERFEQTDVDLAEKVETSFSKVFSGSKFFVVIPLLAGFLYSLQPIIGILTAIFGIIFLWLES